MSLANQGEIAVYSLTLVTESTLAGEETPSQLSATLFEVNQGGNE